ncbi:hypothetical protein GCM10027598_15620 [Amycolatopsis oliviviridis]|uniref:DUF4878 domain-containing protein n=1 Tax=Amycolatopsis oliviviridis TaxID=1471590 RepID=A0ABQ3LSV5_9PSEU|nr:hypothetical protein [Amycolatopsis oliviviridis]GHH25260.1 hypothetical protein GCM10017790_50520 [Amycolatopsis oliviviridis]
MTYPPQPEQPQYGQGGQQHPEQQQYPQAGYDQSGAYSQQPQQQYPGYGQQYPGQYQQYGQGFGGPPAPPKKSNTGLLVGIAAAVVVLVTLAITGFAAPGFFLGDDKADKASGPEATAQAIVDGINAHDRTALTALKCSTAEKDVTQAIEQVGEVSSATLGEITKVSETEYTVGVTVSVEGRSRTASGTLASEGGNWCWKEIGRLRSTKTSTSTTR